MQLQALSDRTDDRCRLHMVPNYNLTFKKELPSHDTKMNQKSHHRTPWLNVIDARLLRSDYGGAADNDPNSQFLRATGGDETPSRRPFTEYNCKRSQDSTAAISKKASARISTSKTRGADSDRVYRALRFVELSTARNTAQRRGGNNVLSRSSSQMRAVRFGFGDGNSRVEDVTDKLSERHSSLLSMPATSPLAFHGGKPGLPQFPTIQLKPQRHCNPSNVAQVPAVNESSSSGDVNSDPSEPQIFPVSTNVVCPPSVFATSSLNSKPLSAMIERPEILLDLLKLAALHQPPSPRGLPIRRPKRAQKKIAHLQNRISQIASKSAFSERRHPPIGDCQKPSKGHVSNRIAASAMPYYSQTAQNCISTRPPAISHIDHPLAPKLFSQKYKILPLPLLDEHMTTAEEKMAADVALSQYGEPKGAQDVSCLQPALCALRSPVQEVMLWSSSSPLDKRTPVSNIRGELERIEYKKPIATGSYLDQIDVQEPPTKTPVTATSYDWFV
ncbi:hypothetical protein QFC19_004790 [Naganishia cerealis]|uniref:Uncharacterized protein n=1 Tax=Naganishia cerealis TaxID=610337 RepID=A0ACC2VT22_9TREE|nr:hypothetical protein QFC19_004790 [Naganishia cerealis]